MILINEVTNLESRKAFKNLKLKTGIIVKKLIKAFVQLCEELRKRTKNNFLREKIQD